MWTCLNICEHVLTFVNLLVPLWTFLVIFWSCQRAGLIGGVWIPYRTCLNICEPILTFVNKFEYLWNWRTWNPCVNLYVKTSPVYIICLTFYHVPEIPEILNKYLPDGAINKFRDNVNIFADFLNFVYFHIFKFLFFKKVLQILLQK